MGIASGWQLGGVENLGKHTISWVSLELQGLELQSVALLTKERCFPGMGSVWYLLLYPCSPSRASASTGEVVSTARAGRMQVFQCPEPKQLNRRGPFSPSEEESLELFLALSSALTHSAVKAQAEIRLWAEVHMNCLGLLPCCSTIVPGWECL